MPRTKAVRVEGSENVKPNRQKLQKNIALAFLKKAEEDVLKKFNEIDEDHMLSTFRRGLDIIIAEVPSADLGKTLKELKLESEKSHCETALFKSIANSTTRSVLKNQTLSSTRTNNISTGSRPGRRSKSQITIKKAKTARTSRSLSRTKIQHAYTASNNFVTPAHRNVLPPTGTITPKMKANHPSVILRRPHQGEMAVSMQGSPLMVSSVATDQTANVNIPLLDGRIVSIQPNRGIRKSELPELDAETLRQMEALRDNLIKVCGMR